MAIGPRLRTMDHNPYLLILAIGSPSPTTAGQPPLPLDAGHHPHRRLSPETAQQPANLPWLPPPSCHQATIAPPPSHNQPPLLLLVGPSTSSPHPFLPSHSQSTRQPETFLSSFPMPPTAPLAIRLHHVLPSPTANLPWPFNPKPTTTSPRCRAISLSSFARIPHQPATSLLSTLPPDRSPSSIPAICTPSTPPSVQDAARLPAGHCSSSSLAVIDPKPLPRCQVAKPPSSTFQDPTTSFDVPRTPLPSSSLLPSFAMAGHLSAPSLSSLLFSPSPSTLLSPKLNLMAEHGSIQQ